METILATYFAWVVALFLVPGCVCNMLVGIFHDRTYSTSFYDFIAGAAVTCLLCLYGLFPVMP